MKTIKPRALRRGDIIGICAPASPAPSDEFIQKGVRYIEQLGYRVELGKSIFRRRGYLAGSDVERAADVNALFADRKISAIIATRGGFGSQRILPLLDYGLIRKHPKIFVGYSDLTALQMALLRRCALVSFSGPMVAAGLSRNISGKAEELFWRTLTSTKPIGNIQSGLRLLRSGSVKGMLIGGNLSLMAVLFGTPYMPSLAGAVLLLEEIGEKPYRVDRMLHQFRLSGTLKGLRGAVLGAFTDCKPEKGKPSLSLSQVFADVFHPYRYPVAAGLRHGHIPNSLTLPIGITVHITGRGSGSISFDEGAVS